MTKDHSSILQAGLSCRTTNDFKHPDGRISNCDWFVNNFCYGLYKRKKKSKKQFSQTTIIELDILPTKCLKHLSLRLFLLSSSVYYVSPVPPIPK